MYDEDAKFSLTAVSPRYAALRPDEDGSWRIVTDSGAPVGVVWLMPGDPSGVGVVWLRQPKPVETLFRHFTEARMAGTTATAAYNAAELLAGVNLGPEQTGKLSGVTDELADMMDES